MDRRFEVRANVCNQSLNSANILQRHWSFFKALKSMKQLILRNIPSGRSVSKSETPWKIRCDLEDLPQVSALKVQRIFMFLHVFAWGSLWDNQRHCWCFWSVEWSHVSNPNFLNWTSCFTLPSLATSSYQWADRTSHRRLSRSVSVLRMTITSYRVS